MITIQEFLKSMPDRESRQAAERLIAVVLENYGSIEPGDVGISLRGYCPAWTEPITLAWIYPPGRKGWMRTRDFSFGAGPALSGRSKNVPIRLRRFLERWADSFSTHPDARDVSSKGVDAWAFTHRDTVANIDMLAERLEKVLRELAALPASG